VRNEITIHWVIIMGFVRYIGSNHGDYVCSIWYSCLMFQDEHVMPWDFNGVFAHSMRPPVITSIKNEVGFVGICCNRCFRQPSPNKSRFLSDGFISCSGYNEHLYPKGRCGCWPKP